MRWWLPFVLLAGCAAPRPAPRISFEDALAAGDPTPPARTEASQLDLELHRFARAARKARLTLAPGAPMPATHLAAWSRLLDGLDGVLRDQPEALTLIRARLQLETEYQADAQLFGDVPLPLTTRVPQTLRRLSGRITQLTVRRRRADPARFLWPVAPVVVSSPYGVRVHPLAGAHRFHAGIDLEVPVAHPVLAVESGTVVFSAWNGAHGKQIELQHDAHWATRYSHLDSLLVRSGTVVKKGQVIGLSGQTGQVTGPHLHFELRRDGDALDPEVFLRAPDGDGPPVLLSERWP